MSTVVNPFYNAFNFADTVSTSVDNAMGVVTAEVNGTTYVYVASRDENAIQVFTIDGNGTLSAVDRTLDDAVLPLDGVFSLDVVTVGDKQFILASGIDDEGLAVFRIRNDGKLVNTDVVDDGPALFLRDVFDVHTVQVGSKTFVYAGSSYEDGISAFQLSAQGKLTSVDTVLDDADLNLNYVTDLDSVEVDGTSFLIATGYYDGVSVFKIKANGTLVNTDNLSDDATVELSGPQAITTTVIGNKTYVYIGAYGDRGISVFTINKNGKLNNVDNYALSNYPEDLDLVEIDGQKILFVTDEVYDTILAYQVNSDGSLELIDSVSDSSDADLLINAPQHSSVVEVDGNFFLITTGAADNGVSVFQIGGGEDALTGTSSADTIIGGASDDDLLGRGGNDKLFGGDGTDVLVGRVGNDLLNGGAGGDILIGGKGKDTADYTGSSAGVTVKTDGSVAKGGDANGDILLGIENLTGSSKGDNLTGDAGKNVLRGEGGGDVLKGLAGNDKLFGDAGNDNLQGGDGKDKLNGGGGKDKLTGGADNDVLKGNNGSDTLDGGGGNDKLLGGGGADDLTGGIGDDVMNGGGGADVFHFVNGDGADQIDRFTDGTDLIDLSGHSSVAGFGDLSTLQLGADTLVLLDGDDSILLTNFDKGDLSNADFIF